MSPALPAIVPHNFRPLDWAVVALYGLVVLGIGFFYSGRQKSSAEYFTASGKVRPFMAGISLCATLLSTISYIAVPGEMVQNGPIFACVYAAAVPFTYLLAGWLLIPSIMKLRVTSAYELLEARLGLPVRLLGSIIFILTRLLWMALILYTSSRIIVDVMGWPPTRGFTVAAGIGVVTMVYTLFGGISAVVLNDVIQFFILFIGAVITLACISHSLGGVSAWWPDHWLRHWASEPFFSRDVHVRLTMVGTCLNTVIWWVCTSGSDQIAIQRYLTTRDARTARQAFLMNNIADVSATILLSLVGLALIAFFTAHPEAMRAGATFARNGDSYFPVYISHYLPLGVTGLVMAGLIAASMSSTSSGINAVIAVFSKDIVETFWQGARETEKTKIKSAHLQALAVGAIIVGSSRLMAAVPGDLLEVGFKTANLFLCPIFGLFFLAMFIRFATPFGAWFSAIYSFAAAVLIAYWDLITGQPRLSFQLIAPVALVVSLGTGCLFSLLPTRGRPRPVLVGYALAALVPVAGAYVYVWK